MRLERKVLLAGLMALMLLILVSGREARAFYTFKIWGGAIHKSISEDGLKEAGLSESSFEIIDVGTTMQDTPFTDAFSNPTHHFLDDQVKGSHDYVEGLFNKIAIKAGKAHTDKNARFATLFYFGELLHTVQDFYAHTNYLELQLKKNMSTPVYEMPLVDWKSLTTQGSGIQASWFYFSSLEDSEGTSTRLECINGIALQHPESIKGPHKWFVDDATFQKSCATLNGYIDYAISSDHKLLHYDINKDDHKSLAGKRIIPSNKSTLYSYAATLAKMETTRMWKRLEDLVRKKYPKDADKIIFALKNYGQKDDLSGEWIIRNQTTGQVSLISLIVDGNKATAEGKGSWKGTMTGDDLKINRPVTMKDRTSCRPKVPPVKVFENALKFSLAIEYDMKVISPTKMEGERNSPYFEWNDKTNLVTKFQRGTPDKVTWEKKQFFDEEVDLVGEWTVTNSTSGATSTVKIKVSGGSIIAEGKKKWTGTLGKGELRLTRDIVMADRMDCSPTPPESAFKEALGHRPKAQQQLVIVSPARMEGQLTSPWIEWNEKSGKLTKYVDSEADNVIWEKK